MAESNARQWFEKIEDLEKWIGDHEHLGKIKDQDVFSDESKEIRGGLVDGATYNKALLIGKTLGFKKSQILISALELFSKNKGMFTYQRNKILKRGTNFNCEFRGTVPIELTKPLIEFIEQDGMSLFMSVVLDYWIEKNNNEANLKIEKRSKELGVTVEQVIQSIYDSWLLHSRKKRLRMSKKVGYIIRDRKV